MHCCPIVAADLRLAVAEQRLPVAALGLVPAVQLRALEVVFPAHQVQHHVEAVLREGREVPQPLDLG
eukprot:5035928-Alexandrium_andersonii.AAC.1